MHRLRWLVDALMMMERPSRVSRKAWLIVEYRAKCGPCLPEVRDVLEYEDERSILDASQAERNDQGYVELPGMDSMAFMWCLEADRQKSGNGSCVMYTRASSRKLQLA
jgi:hypothetical protein